MPATVIKVHVRSMIIPPHRLLCHLLQVACLRLCRACRRWVFCPSSATDLTVPCPNSASRLDHMTFKVAACQGLACVLPFHAEESVAEPLSQQPNDQVLVMSEGHEKQSVFS